MNASLIVGEQQYLSNITQQWCTHKSYNTKQGKKMQLTWMPPYPTHHMLFSPRLGRGLLFRREEKKTLFGYVMRQNARARTRRSISLYYGERKRSGNCVSCHAEVPRGAESEGKAEEPFGGL